MRDDEQRGVGELLADAALDEGVGEHVDGGGGLVEEQEARAREDGAREAEELFLSLREVAAGGRDGGAEIEEDVGVSCIGVGTGVGACDGGCAAACVRRALLGAGLGYGSAVY